MSRASWRMVLSQKTLKNAIVNSLNRRSQQAFSSHIHIFAPIFLPPYPVSHANLASVSSSHDAHKTKSTSTQLIAFFRHWIPFFSFCSLVFLVLIRILIGAIARLHRLMAIGLKWFFFSLTVLAAQRSFHIHSPPPRITPAAAAAVEPSGEKKEITSRQCQPARLSYLNNS